MRLDSTLNALMLSAQETSHPQPLITPPPPRETNDETPTVSRPEPRDIVEFQGIEVDLDPPQTAQAPSDPPQPGIDSRALSPREMADFSLDLYIDGAVSFDEYSLIAFQAELHPDYDETIGALTGEYADPDEPRDYIQEWEDRYNFERRYPSESPKTLEQIERILTVLSSFQAPIDHAA